MPTYTNALRNEVFSGEPNIRFAPKTTTITNKYVRELPVGVTLTDHEPTVKPWTLLAEVTATPMSAAVEVYGHYNVVIYNASDDVARVAANEDADNAYSIMASSKEIFSNSDSLVGCIEIISMGTGTVYIYGVR